MVDSVKTAISVRRPLFDEINEAARELNVSRSRFFSMAAEDFIQRIKNKKLLHALNEAYDDSPDAIEKEVLDGMKKLQRNLSGDGR